MRIAKDGNNLLTILEKYMPLSLVISVAHIVSLAAQPPLFAAQIVVQHVPQTVAAEELL